MNLFYFAGITIEQSDAASRHTLEISHNLALRGHKIWLFIPHNHLPIIKPLHRNIQIIPVRIHYGHNQLLISILFYLALPWVSWSYFQKIHPEIVYTRASFLDFIAIAPLKLFFKFTYVAELNGIRSLETTGNIIKRWIIAWFEHLSISLCDKVIGVTPKLREWVIKQGRLPAEHVAVIGNGVSTDMFFPIQMEQAKHQVNLTAHKRYLNFTGSLKSWHGTHLLIEALPKILSEFPHDICLLIVGDGPEKPVLLNRARQLGVKDVVQWIGSVPIHKVPYYINASEICLAPFVLERNVKTGISPIKIFEYMACARPIITTRIEITYNNMIESCHCGILVPPNDVTALAEAIIYLLHNPEKSEQLGKNGRKTVIEQYSWGKIAAQIEHFITSP